MNLQILEDGKARPDLFCWAGPIDAERLTGWVQAKMLTLPVDLFELLVATGGGDLFETEMILCPFGDRATGETAADMNAFHRKRGLPSRLWIFHIGYVQSAIIQPIGEIVVLSPGYALETRYQRLNDWYVDVIRNEFAERYGLGPMPINQVPPAERVV